MISLYLLLLFLQTAVLSSSAGAVSSASFMFLSHTIFLHVIRSAPFELLQDSRNRAVIAKFGGVCAPPGNFDLSAVKFYFLLPSASVNKH
jgi:hypothetical protein